MKSLNQHRVCIRFLPSQHNYHWTMTEKSFRIIKPQLRLTWITLRLKIHQQGSRHVRLRGSLLSRPGEIRRFLPSPLANLCDNEDSGQPFTQSALKSPRGSAKGCGGTLPSQPISVFRAWKYSSLTPFSFPLFFPSLCVDGFIFAINSGILLIA